MQGYRSRRRCACHKYVTASSRKAANLYAIVLTYTVLSATCCIASPVLTDHQLRMTYCTPVNYSIY